MDKRYLAAAVAATAGCLAFSLLVTRLRPFSSSLQVEAATVVPSTDEPTDRSPETYQGSVFFDSAAAMLDGLGVAVYPQDKVYAFPDPALGIGSTVKVYRAQSVVVTDGSNKTAARTWATTVGAVLAEQHIDLGTKDRVEPSLDSPITLSAQPFSIAITRVAETQLSINSSIDYGTTYKDDATLEKGKTAVDQAGAEGILQKTYLVRRENGAEVSRTLLSSAVTKQPVNEVIRRGTKVIDYGSGGASWYAAPSMTAAHRTLPLGTKVLVTNTANGKSVVVTIADRGPFIAGRIIDLSPDAFAALGSLSSGVMTVRLEKN